MKKLLGIALILGFVSSSIGQQTPTFDHYLTNQYLVNPAAAGLNGNNAYLDLRNQWQGFVGAPQTQALTVDGNFKREKFGLGLKIVNDKVNIIGATSAYLTYSYNVKFSETHKLKLGLSGGLYQNRIIYDNIVAEDPTEAQIFGKNQSASNFDANLGLLYTLGNFSLGASAFHILPNSYYYEDNYSFNALTFTNIRHFLVNSQYDFHLKGGKWVIQPSILAKGVQGLPFLMEGGVTGVYKDQFWMTARYAHEVGYTVVLGGKIINNLTLAYAYSLSSNQIMTQTNGTHEILLGYKFGKGSNVGAELSSKELEMMKSKNAAMYEKIDYLEKENEQMKEELKKQKELLKNSVYGLEELKEELEKEKEDLEEMIKNNKFEPSTTNPDGSPIEYNEDGTKIPASGNLYVIIGATRGIENAKEYQGIVAREYNQQTMIIRNSRDSWFLIYTVVTDDIDAAQKELKRVKEINTKDIYVGKPWIYKL